ncbi:MAG: hypothetical protein JW762_03190 [Dehalococcoidales bacterium]|nr:hypothetical protein [Dehalococcoidales bacterium]
MAELTYLCRKCGIVFRSSAEEHVLLANGPACPKCGSDEARELPSWAPAGSDINNAPVAWEHECQDCHQKFSLPIPQSPSRETCVLCPFCRGSHIHRLTPAGYEPLYCG